MTAERKKAELRKKKRTRRRFSDIRRGSTEEYQKHLAVARQELIEANLAEMRKLVGKTQGEMADIIGAAQSHISQTEGREDHMVSTLKSYVEALGGELEVIAKFDDKSIRLRGV